MTVSQHPRELLELPAFEARAHLLKQESYCNYYLPPYIDFSGLLADVHARVGGKNQKGIGSKGVRRLDGVNYVITDNKDGRLAWRPLTLIHPVLYAGLVDVLTTEANWEFIRDRFSKLDSGPNIYCASKPLVAEPPKSSDRATVRRWRLQMELRSIELALQYSYVVSTDIANCYGSIYTHSIAWALHGRGTAKRKRRDHKLLGNVVDEFLKDMNAGQTNGICQGSAVMDLLAETILAYVDHKLLSKLRSERVEDYQIVRFRDDYRIFVNERRVGESILKSLAEVLMGLGMALSAAKTDASDDVIGRSVKEDKIHWLFRSPIESDLVGQLLAVRTHSLEYPNGGSVTQALDQIVDGFEGVDDKNQLLPLISIVADISMRNPRAYRSVTALLSRLVSEFSDPGDGVSALQTLTEKFRRIPNSELLHLCGQRIGLPLGYEWPAESAMCRLVRKRNSIGCETALIWNSDWIADEEIRSTMKQGAIVDRKVIQELLPIVSKDEISAFDYGYWV